MFNCRPLFIDMEEELKLFEEKWTKEYELKKAKEAEEKLKAEEAAKNNKPTEQKKNIFAKFKSYNKDAGGKISMAAPPKNSIPNKATVETKEGEKILLKERANRYTYEGKFANFNFLQKIERKVFNKKLGISFADFKKMKN
jgi:cobalamin biosynthesis protein CbiG